MRKPIGMLHCCTVGCKHDAVVYLDCDAYRHTARSLSENWTRNLSDRAAALMTLAFRPHRRTAHRIMHRTYQQEHVAHPTRISLVASRTAPAAGKLMSTRLRYLRGTKPIDTILNAVEAFPNGGHNPHRSRFPTARASSMRAPPMWHCFPCDVKPCGRSPLGSAKCS